MEGGRREGRRERDGGRQLERKGAEKAERGRRKNAKR